MTRKPKKVILEVLKEELSRKDREYKEARWSREETYRRHYGWQQYNPKSPSPNPYNLGSAVNKVLKAREEFDRVDEVLHGCSCRSLSRRI